MMTEVFTREKRSKVMARIKSGGKKLGCVCSQRFFATCTFSDSLETKNCSGKPDFYFASLRYASS